MASDGIDYALLGVDIDGTNSTLFSATRSVDGWSDNVSILTIGSGVFDSVTLGSGTGTYLPLWSQPAAIEPIANRLWLLPDIQ